MRPNLNNQFLDLYEELSKLNEGDFLNTLNIKTLPLRASDITRIQTKQRKTVREDDSVAKHGPYKELSDPSLKVGDQVKVFVDMCINLGTAGVTIESWLVAAKVIHLDANFIYVQSLERQSLYKIRKSKIEGLIR